MSGTQAKYFEILKRFLLDFLASRSFSKMRGKINLHAKVKGTSFLIKH